jgi:hypothetical protein
MHQTKLIEIEKVPPFRIYSSLFRTVYISGYPPFVKVRNIANLEAPVVTGMASICVRVRGIKNTEAMCSSPTVEELIRQARRLSLSVCRAISKIEVAERGVASSLTALVVMRVYWSEDARCFHCDVTDLREEFDLGEKDIDF